MREYAVDLNDAGSCLPELVRRAARGEDVILTDQGLPVARIIPSAPGPRDFGSARGLIHMNDDFDAPIEGFDDYV